MTYVLCKHKKTGSERVFTEPVFRASEHQYKFISYTENPNGKVKRAPAALASEVAEGIKAPKVEVKADADVTDSVLADLQSQYKALTGKEAKKNWGVPKLTEEIKKAETATV